MIDLLQINADWFTAVSSFIGGGALGGLISTIVNHKENRRIKKGEAVRSEAVAKKEDASAATEMMGLLERTVAHIELLQLQRVEDHRRVMDLEKIADREIAWRKDSDFHYCEVEDCRDRRPPIGTLKRMDKE